MLWTCHVLVHSCSHIGPGSSSLVRGHFASNFPPWFRSFPPPSPMLHRWVVVEVVPWEFPTSCIPTSLQTLVCWDCICQLMGRPVWDWGHPEDSGPAVSFSLMCSIGPDFFAPRLKWCVVIAAALVCWMLALATYKFVRNWSKGNHVVNVSCTCT